MNCTPLEPVNTQCEGLRHQTPKTFYPGQSGASGKTTFHQKFKSGKKPQGKFTGMKK